MPQNNRNSMRGRKEETSRRYQEEEDRRYSPRRQEQRSGSISRASFERTDQRSTERENDLYERQSI